MDAGNDAYRAGEFEPAVAHYMDGLTEAERLLREASEHGASTGSSPAPALVVAAGNAANAYAALGRWRKAIGVRLRAIAGLRAVVSSPTASDSFRLDCLPHLDRACSELTAQAREAGIHNARINDAIAGAQRDALVLLELTKSTHYH